MQRGEVGRQRTAVARQVEARRLVAGRPAGIDVERRRDFVSQADVPAPVVVIGRAVLNRVRAVLHRRQELERGQCQQRVHRGVGIVGIGEGLHARRNLAKGCRVGTGEGADFSLAGRTTEAEQRANLRGETLREDRGVTRGHQVDVREHIGARRIGDDLLLVLGVVRTKREDETIGDLEIDIAEDRERFIVLNDVVEEALAFSKELAGVIGAVQRRERGFERIDILRAAGRTLQQQVGERTEAGTKNDLIRRIDAFVEVIAADQEVERAVEVRGNPQFLGEGFDIGITDIRPAHRRKAGEVDVLVGAELGLAIGGDRGQPQRAEVVIDLARDAVVLDVVDRIDVGEHDIAIGIVAEIVDLAAEQLDRTDFGRGRHVEHAAAALFDLVVIADYADAQRAAIVEQQLAAGEPAVAVVDVVAIDAIGQVAVTLVDAAARAEGDRIADRAGDETLEDHRVVIAVAGFDHAAEIELRFLGDDRDHARAGVLAEQRGLRAAQHFDALDVGKIGDLRHRAAAIDAVDEHRDRGLKADVVAIGAEAADRIAGRERALVLADAQRGDQRGEIGDVANLGLLDRFGGGHADRDGGFLQRLLALGRGDDDHIAAGGSGDIGIVGLDVRVGVLRLGGGGQNQRGSAGQQGGTNGRVAAESIEFHEMSSSLKTSFWSAAQSPNNAGERRITRLACPLKRLADA